MKYNKLYLSLIIGFFGILFLGFMAASVLPKAFVTWTKAAPASKVSLGNSYLIGGRILAKADGTDKCVVNVFVMDSSGKGVKGVPVNLSGMVGEDLQSVSENDGKAIFELTSNREGQFSLIATINGIPLEKVIKVTFRN